MTPLELVLSQYTLPDKIKEVHPKQVRAINEQAYLPNSGQWLGTGTGKTLVASVTSLYKKIKYGVPTVIIMPPLLIEQWDRWLAEFKPKLKVVAYHGTPAHRKSLSFEGADFVLVGPQIFKKEYDKFMTFFLPIHPNVVVDEATMVCNIGTGTHEAIYDFAIGCNQELLTGTPANNPMDAYGLLKFTNPGAYRNLKHFENMHVEGRDFFDRPNEFKNLGMLKSALAKNSQTILFSDMYPHMPDPLYMPYKYSLSPKHMKLYTQLAEQQLLILPDGGKIEATTASKIIHALGQLIVNWEYFSQDESNISEAIKHVEQKLEELGDGKLVVFANYKLSIAALIKNLGTKYGAVAINSEVTQVQKQRNLDRFTNDPKCRLIVIQPKSGGYGLDGLQHVCNYSMFLEPCTIPRDFHQSVARLLRTGQRSRVVVYLPTAEGTLQYRRFKQLLANDELMNQFVTTKAELREMIYGR